MLASSPLVLVTLALICVAPDVFASGKHTKRVQSQRHFNPPSLPLPVPIPKGSSYLIKFSQDVYTSAADLCLDWEAACQEHLSHITIKPEGMQILCNWQSKTHKTRVFCGGNSDTSPDTFVDHTRAAGRAVQAVIVKPPKSSKYPLTLKERPPAPTRLQLKKQLNALKRLEPLRALAVEARAVTLQRKLDERRLIAKLRLEHQDQYATVIVGGMEITFKSKRELKREKRALKKRLQREQPTPEGEEFAPGAIFLRWVREG